MWKFDYLSDKAKTNILKGLGMLLSNVFDNPCKFNFLTLNITDCFIYTFKQCVGIVYSVTH